MPDRVPFRPKQSLGQNFIHDPNMIAKIVDTLEAPPDAAVVEVGAGTGALTERLVAKYDNLLAVEVDERAVEVLRGTLPELDVREQDVREVDWEAVAEERGRPLHVISNTPYYLTTEILFALLEARGHVAEAVLTMQKEVAERIVAEPRTKAYGILSVLLQLFASPHYAFTVSRHVFYPQPDVTSAVLHVTFDADAGPVNLTLDEVRPIVQDAFNQRRKMLRNSLSAWTTERDLPEEIGRKRAEALSPADFADLARYLHGKTDSLPS
ncbi:ribosomal RNA small subunit methyltransferase A [Longibacter salinarum]|uniref:Ribosomal RNA small subunit methyltransferase A n=1 Tax=Longibacter salinarum TaxID=1850348 RepID=A0A2A8CXB7_9BACT|nr:16S rRNA (adenine(1518)-N(6)/adenine(1519)-N(6))-dimethyltransferase RsmA [Longibacter salinarum]PEN13389.1 ribosomal RNA small subunit methyltransferase A [Longibacter salinarum]